MKRNFAIAVKSLIFKENKILVLKRSRSEMEQSRINKIDLWDLPGGGLQYFEKTQQGLEREIKEETGLDVLIVKPFDIHDIIRPHIHIVIITYLCNYLSGEVVLSEEHEGFDWMSMNDAQGANMQKWMKKMFEKAFEEYTHTIKI